MDGDTAAHLAVISNAELTIRLDNGSSVRFQIVNSTTGEIRITNVEVE